MAHTFQFIFQMIAVISLGVIIYIVSRGIPRVPREESVLREFHMFDRVISKLPLQKFDAFLDYTIRKF